MSWNASESWVWKKVYGTRFYKLIQKTRPGILQYGVVDDFGQIVLVMI